MSWRIWLSPPVLEPSDHEAVSSALKSGWIAPLGPEVDGFESDLSAYASGREVVALSSGTAAIHLALRMLSLQPGDLVLCQSFTFTASANPILYEGGTPVFIDSEITSQNISPEYLRDAISSLRKGGKVIRACIAVDLYGRPADYEELVPLLDEAGIPLISDAAESLGSIYLGKRTGSFGQFGIFSFNGNKIITSSGGGALVCSSHEQAEKVRFLATQARDKAPHYQHSELGYNYRLSNILASLGRSQLRSLPGRIARKREILNRYRELLKGRPEIQVIQETRSDVSSNCWLSMIEFQRDSYKPGIVYRAQSKLAEQSIESRPLWKPLHLQPLFSSAPYYGENNAENSFDYGLCLPSGVGLTDAEQEEIVHIILGVE